MNWWYPKPLRSNVIRGDPEMVAVRRRLLQAASLFPLDQEILELARVLIAPGAIPEKAGPDAVHIAAASVAKCDFLLTWNFRHIANVRIRSEVEKIWQDMAMQEQQSAHPKSSSDYEPWEDDVLRDVYVTRDDYAAEHGYDLDRIYADLKQREASSLLRKSNDERSVQG
jgi:hypothetical protein